MYPRAECFTASASQPSASLRPSSACQGLLPQASMTLAGRSAAFLSDCEAAHAHSLIPQTRQ
eukprot:26290-Eustigmatos_ZCMA.PRE.1